MAAASSIDNHVTPGVSAARVSVLMVDDQPARLLTYETILESLGLNLVRAYSGVEALDKLLKEEFAVILLDVNMPNMDGFELARLVREHPRLERTPIIFLTGMHLSDIDQLKAYEVGAIDYIHVPVVPEVLRSKVTVLVELHQRRRELREVNRELAQARARLEAEHATVIARKEAQLRAVFEHPSDVTVVIRAERDASGAVTDWIYRDANTNALSLLGVTRDALLGRRITEILPERAQAGGERCARALSSGVPERYEVRVRERDFSVTMFSIGDDTVVSSSVDITDQKRAEAALRESERRYRALIEDAPVAVAHNTMNGRFEYANRAFCALLGYTLEELQEKTWQEMTYPDDLPRDLQLGQRVLASEIPFYTTEKRYFRKDGSIVWVELFGNFVMDDRGHPLQGVAVAIDITERRNADRRKDEFLAMLAHELRNPVAPISTAADLLSRQLQDDADKRGLVEIVGRQAAHLSRLLDDLLDIARITQGRIELRREIVSIADCVKQAVETAEPLIRERGHRLTLSHTMTSLHVDADRVRLVQSISNILLNAAKYTNAGGEIRIQTTEVGGHAVLAISDTGIGIGSDLLPRIFELFVQSERPLDRSLGGLGIGLALSRQLIEMHGGTIAASSPGLGLGATFTIRLPLVEPHADAPRDSMTATLPSRRVLIVDDNTDSADTLAMLLEFEGHLALAVYSASSALEQVAEFDPDIVLLDIGLPEMDGYEVARRINQRPDPPRLVAVSGYGQVEERRRSAEAGFSAHLLKPVDIGVLKNVLASDN